ncbi:MAG: hypothetical protein AABW65_00100 [Nanoarchaeota archaeon]
MIKSAFSYQFGSLEKVIRKEGSTISQISSQEIIDAALKHCSSGPCTIGVFQEEDIFPLNYRYMGELERSSQEFFLAAFKKTEQYAPDLISLVYHSGRIAREEFNINLPEDFTKRINIHENIYVPNFSSKESFSFDFDFYCRALNINFPEKDRNNLDIEKMQLEKARSLYGLTRFEALRLYTLEQGESKPYKLQLGRFFGTIYTLMNKKE